MKRKHPNFDKHKRLIRMISWTIILGVCVAMIVLFGNLLEPHAENAPVRPSEPVEATIAMERSSLTPETTEPAEVIPACLIMDVAEEIAPPETTEPEPTEPSYSEEDVEIMAQVMCYEAGGTSEENLLLVGSVIRNRVESELYPDTYYAVVTQPSQYGELDYWGPFWPQWTDHDYREYCRELARRVITGEYECPENVLYQSGAIQGSGVYKEVDGHYFCYA